MASAASAPSRSSILARMPSASSRAEKNSNGGTRSARARQRSRVSAGRLEARIGGGARHQLLPQEALPLGRERQEVVVVEAEQRRLEHAGERQIVLRQAEEIAERDQVLHGDLLGQHQAVGAGDLDAARLEGRDHGRRERRALAHQDQDVAGADGAVLGRQHLRGLRASPRMVWAMRPASRTTGEEALASASGDQGSARLGLLRLLGRPDLDQPRVPDAMGDMPDRRRRRGHAGRARAVGEDARRPPPAAARRRETTSSAARGANRGPPARRGARTPRPCRRTWWAPRPGSCRSTASRRRRRTACAPRRARRAPEKNSSASARITSHCTGLVSCASSTRMWSRPPSSL